MAIKLTLPARSNAIDYSDEQVIDTLLSLHDAAKGQGVVIDSAQDTEAKARVRCRTMAEKVKADQRPTVAQVLAMEFDNLDPFAEFFAQDSNGTEVTPTFDDGGTFTGATDEKGKAVKDASAYNIVLVVPGVNTKTHTVAQGEGDSQTWLPVLSVKQ